MEFIAYVKKGALADAPQECIVVDAGSRTEALIDLGNQGYYVLDLKECST